MQSHPAEERNLFTLRRDTHTPTHTTYIYMYIIECKIKPGSTNAAQTAAAASLRLLAELVDNGHRLQIALALVVRHLGHRVVARDRDHHAEERVVDDLRGGQPEGAHRHYHAGDARNLPRAEQQCHDDHGERPAETVYRWGVMKSEV